MKNKLEKKLKKKPAKKLAATSKIDNVDKRNVKVAKVAKTKKNDSKLVKNIDKKENKLTKAKGKSIRAKHKADIRTNKINNARAEKIKNVANKRKETEEAKANKHRGKLEGKAKKSKGNVDKNKKKNAKSEHRDALSKVDKVISEKKKFLSDNEAQFRKDRKKILFSKLSKAAEKDALDKNENRHHGWEENFVIEIEQLERKREDILISNKPSAKLKAAGLSLRQIRKKNTSAKKVPIAAPMMSNENIIEVRNVFKYYTSAKMSFKILKGISFSVREGEFSLLVGKSGSGKSTLLNLMSGLDRVTDGDIVINGQNISAMKGAQVTRWLRRDVGFIFQKYNLLPNLNAYENVEVGAVLQKDRKKRIDIKELFELMDISDCLYKYPAELSGGQQQRVSIARALSKNPRVLFADEPTGALDEKMSDIVLKILKNINKKYGTTIVMVTHDLSIERIVNKVIGLKEGHIQEVKIIKNPISVEEMSINRD